MSCSQRHFYGRGTQGLGTEGAWRPGGAIGCRMGNNEKQTIGILKRRVVSSRACGCSRLAVVKVSTVTVLGMVMGLALALLGGVLANPAAADPTCAGSLQALVDAAAPGATVEASGGCVYREMVTIDKPLTLKAAPGGTEIRGSDIWGDAVWSQQGSTWVSNKAVPALTTESRWECQPNTNRCRWPEQVFIDGRQLTQVAVGTAPLAGQFALNASRKVILGESPLGKSIEVTVRNHWIEGASGGVTIDGFSMRHAASAGIDNNWNGNWTIRNGDFSYSHTSNLKLSRATGLLVLNNKFHHGGQLGVAGSLIDLTLQGNESYENNTEDFDSFWEAGGVKISGSKNVTFDGNTVYANHGNGLWLDVPTDNQVLVVKNNRVHHNDANGIRSEVTDDNVQIYGNVVWANGWGRSGSTEAGISLNASHDNRVYDNVVAWNQNGIRVVNSRRTIVNPDQTEYDFVYNVEVDHNDILMNGHAYSPSDSEYALSWDKTYTNGGNLYDPAANNRGHDNRYWYPAPEGSEKRYKWEVDLTSLSAFNDTLGEEGGLYLSDAEKDDIAATNGIPASPPDTTAPAVEIATPPEEATYTANQTVNAQYSCADEAVGSGLASCQGPVADGAAIYTSSTGSRAFTVTATDNAGNTNSVTHTYTVCTIIGSASSETLTGTSGDDVICGGEGNDIIKGLGGNDTLRGEGGADKLLGGTGSDGLRGGTGTDTASYSASHTAVSASLATNTATGEGSDTIADIESLLGSANADTLTGSGINNTLTGGGGNDTVRGGAGKDTVVGSGGADNLYGNDGNDSLDSKDGVSGNDLLDGGAGTDTKTTDATEKSIVGFP